MKISKKDWQNYINKLRKINEKAADKVVEYMQTHDYSTSEGMKALITYAHAVATKYGEGAAELSCQMYDAIAEVAGVYVPLAEPAATATYGEIAKTVYGTMASTKDPDAIGAAVGRTVKMAGVDTTMQNAIRDGAEWAWIPSGDTCAYCLMLASFGWQKASKKALKNNHASHIHNNCDCTFAIRFDESSTVEGYDSKALEKQFEDAGDTTRERLNTLSRQHYASNKDAIRAQKREAYAKKKIKDTIEELEKEAAIWVEKLTDQEKQSISKYAFNPGDKSPNRFFERINAMLRGEIIGDENLKKHADEISSGIKKFNVEKDFYVYRRVDHDPAEGLEVGDIFRGEQFLSTSVDPEKALKKEYQITIRVKKGTSAAYIDSLSEFDQTELLIDKDALYRVKSKSEKEIVWEVII